MKKPLAKIIGFSLLLSAALASHSLQAHAGFSFMGLDFNPPCDMSGTKVIKGTPEEIFQRATEFEAAHDYCNAAQNYLEASHQATGQIFHDSKFRTIDMLYQASEYDSSITAAKEYIYWHPTLTQERTEYAYYMIALNFYLERNGVQEDQRETAMAQMYFADYLDKYPAGKYADDAKKFLKNSYDELAMRQIIIGKYYLKSKDYTAAAARLQNVPMHFKSSSNLPEALYYITIAYTALEKDKEATAVRTLMEKLFKASPFTAQTEAFLDKEAAFHAEVKKNPPSDTEKLLTCGGIVYGSAGEKCAYSVLKTIDALQIKLEEAAPDFSWGDLIK